jgi:hypothetical protein
MGKVERRLVNYGLLFIQVYFHKSFTYNNILIVEGRKICTLI